MNEIKHLKGFVAALMANTGGLIPPSAIRYAQKNFCIFRKVVGVSPRCTQQVGSASKPICLLLCLRTTCGGKKFRIFFYLSSGFSLVQMGGGGWFGSSISSENDRMPHPGRSFSLIPLL